MLLFPTKMHVQLMQMLQKSSKWRAFGHLCEGVHVLGEALAAIAILAIGPWHVGVGIVDISRKKHACMHCAPVGTHLFAIFTAGVEVGDFISTKYIVHVFGQLCLQWGHDGKLLANKDLGKQLVRTCEYHGLFLEVLYMCALGQELRHVAHLVASLF